MPEVKTPPASLSDCRAKHSADGSPVTEGLGDCDVPFEIDHELAQLVDHKLVGSVGLKVGDQAPFGVPGECVEADVCKLQAGDLGLGLSHPLAIAQSADCRELLVDASTQDGVLCRPTGD